MLVAKDAPYRTVKEFVAWAKARPEPVFSGYGNTSSRVPSALFAEQMAYLAQQRYTTLTVSQYISVQKTGAALPAAVVVLTFDDGFADFYAEALHILKQHGFVASPYVAGPYVEGEYEVELPVTARLIEALRPEYRESFEAQRQ